MLPLSSSEFLPIDGRLWQFALRVYRQDGVPTACLALQDHFEADVTLLLFAGWVAVELQMNLSPEQCMQVNNLVSPWHQHIVKTLRQMRISLKSGPSPAPIGETEYLRADIKAAELKAECLELAFLENISSKWIRPELSGGTDPVRSNLVMILRLTTKAESVERASCYLDILERAIWQVKNQPNYTRV
ncbi:MAG TPA: TIGR02444 family protein [Acidocella sp.]|nr:TIGR02444 family protein [Acidocella sp.]